MGSKFGISLQQTKSAIVLTEVCPEKKQLLWISNVVKSCGLIFWTQFIYINILDGIMCHPEALTALVQTTLCLHANHTVATFWVGGNQVSSTGKLSHRKKAKSTNVFPIVMTSD